MTSQTFIFSAFSRGQDEMAVLVFCFLEQHVDGIARLDGDHTVLVAELVDIDHAFGLVSDIDDDFAVRNLQHFTFDDFAFGDIGVVRFQQLFVFRRGNEIFLCYVPSFDEALSIVGFHHDLVWFLLELVRFTGARSFRLRMDSGWVRFYKGGRTCKPLSYSI